MKVPKLPRGFTVIELLVVVVVVGVLVGFALPRFRTQKYRAIQGTMESDLANLAKTQEGYYYNFGAYAPNIAALNMDLSPGNNVVINEATTAGWSATLVHIPSIGKTCYIFYGNAAPVGSATREGLASCS